MSGPDDKTSPAFAPANQQRTVLDQLQGGPYGIVGRYRLTRALGVGGMAEAFEAQAVGAHGFTRAVAVKRPLPAASAEMITDFLNEARIAARIHHHNVIQVVDLDLDAENRPFLVMELVDGCNLAELLEKVPRLPFSVTIHVIASVLRGLAAAHDLTSDSGRPLLIVHRDISPQNVFLSREGAVKVGDWGIAKETGITSRIGQSTEPGVVKGKLAYMAPEQLNGVAPDRRADLYAVGLMLWEMLAGCSFSQRAEALLSGPVGPSTLNPEVPSDLDAVARELLETGRTHRPANAHDVIAAIEACADAEVGACDELASLVIARAPAAKSSALASRGRSTTSRVRSRVPLMVILTAAAAALVAAVAVAAVSTTRADRTVRLVSPAEGALLERSAATVATTKKAPKNPFVEVSALRIEAQQAAVTNEEYSAFRRKLSDEYAKEMLPVGGESGPPSAPVTWVTFAQATRYCAALQARLPTSEEWAFLAASNGGLSAGAPSEWTSTVKDGLALVREPGDQARVPKSPFYKDAIAFAGVRPDVVAGKQIGFRCVR